MDVADPADIPLQPRPPGSLAPLTANTLGLWNTLLEGGAALSSMRQCVSAVRIVGSLDTVAVRRSIEALVHRHEPLRTRIVPVEGVPRQMIDEAGEYHLDVVDLAEGSYADVDHAARHFAQEFLQEKIDVAVGPLFAARLFRLSDGEHVLIVALDHLISDATSWVILEKEFWSLYGQCMRGEPMALPPLPVQFADYSLWQERVRDAWLRKHKAYWIERLAGAPRVQIPLDHAPSELRDPIRDVLHFPLGKTLSVRLREMAQREGTLLPLAVLGIYVAAMAQWCGQRDLLVSFMSHGRHRRPELVNMIGYVAHDQLFRVKLTSEDSCLELMKRVQQEFQAVHEHHDFGLVAELAPGVRTEISFNWQPTNWARSSARQSDDAKSIKLQPFVVNAFPPGKVPSEYRLAPLFYDSATGIVMTVFYRPDLFRRSTIEGFSRRICALATQFVERPHSRIEPIPLEASGRETERNLATLRE